jgi:mannose-6-phosphate isomerase-like protein (cupin superfamily)
MKMMIKILHNNTLIAIIIPASYKSDGIEFFTPDTFSQQLAFMSHKKGKVIDAHVHNHNPREVVYTQEVLVMRKGKLRVDFYDDERNYLESRVLEAGDVILLASGGHGFEVIEDVEMIEIKQGPFSGEGDKTRFVGVTSDGSRVTRGEVKSDEK